MLPFETIKREILVKKESETSKKFGVKPDKRTTEELINYGVVNINKPRGPTSHQVSDFVKKILKINKAGHAGTLDPRVTGVLPVALGRATRIVQTLLTAGKEYVALMHLHKEVDEKKLRNVFNEFTGKIRQMPPIKSSVKRQLRTREVYYLSILEIERKDVLFKVGCEAGTYIRKLIHDIGEKLKTGAHMVELRRTKAGPFDESTLTTLQDLADAYYYFKEGNKEEIRKIIMPIESAVIHLPKVWVFDNCVDAICHGASLAVPGVSKLELGIKKEDIVAVMTLKNELVCIGNANMSSDEIIQSKKGLAVITKKVFMLPETYKKI